MVFLWTLFRELLGLGECTLLQGWLSCPKTGPPWRPSGGVFMCYCKPWWWSCHRLLKNQGEWREKWIINGTQTSLFYSLKASTSLNPAIMEWYGEPCWWSANMLPKNSSSGCYIDDFRLPEGLHNDQVCRKGGDSCWSFGSLKAPMMAGFVIIEALRKLKSEQDPP